MCSSHSPCASLSSVAVRFIHTFRLFGPPADIMYCYRVTLFHHPRWGVWSQESWFSFYVVLLVNFRLYLSSRPYFVFVWIYSTFSFIINDNTEVICKQSWQWSQRKQRALINYWAVVPCNTSLEDFWFLCNEGNRQDRVGQTWVFVDGVLPRR